MVNEHENITCKYCQSPSVVKFGTYKGVQRYWCKECKRKFKDDDALFHMKGTPQHVSSALSMYYSGMSINDVGLHLFQEHGYHPSKHVVYNWVDKYTTMAVDHFRDYKPNVGDVWVADETMLDIDNRKVWFWDLIDRDTRFLIASRVSLTRTTEDAQKLMESAYKRTGKAPKTVITDALSAYLDGIELTFGGETEHKQSRPFSVKEDSTNLIERFHSTLKERTKVMRSFRDIDTLIQFTDGFLVYYNFLRPHESLQGKTPAQVAKVDYDVKNWLDVSRLPVSKETEIKSHTTPILHLPKIRVVMTKRPKRHKQVRKPRRIESGEYYPSVKIVRL